MKSYLKNVGMYIFLQGIFSSFMNIYDSHVWKVQTHLLSSDFMFPVPYKVSVKMTFYNILMTLEMEWKMSPSLI